LPDEQLAQLSDRLFLATVLLYTVAMLAFAAEQAVRRSRRVADATAAGMSLREATAARTRAMAGAGGPTAYVPPVPAAPAAVPAASRGSRAGIAGLLLTGVGVAVHVGSVVTRGMAADRTPWGTCTSSPRWSRSWPS
jgi:hypothetical protein